MSSLWEKINRKLHEIVDRALDAHSLALYDQYLRDVEAYREQVEASAARIYAGIQANQRKLAQHEADLAQLDAGVDRRLAAGEEEVARMMQGDLEIQRELVATTRQQIANQESDYQRLLAGRQETQERLQVLRHERPAVQSLMAVVKAGDLIEKIELTLGNLAQLGESSAAGEIAAGILRRFDEAEVRWQLSAARLGLEQASLELEQSRIEDQLAERMRRLGLDDSE